MSGSQYWASLRGMGIFIYLFLFCLFLGVTIFAVLYDRISTFQIWNSPIWLRVKTPLIILLVAGSLAALLTYIRHEGRQELQAVKDYAKAQGWAFSRDDTVGLKALVVRILNDLEFELRNIRTIETGRRSLYLFDCSYRHRESAARSSYSRGTGSLVLSERFPAAAVPLEIVARDWTEALIADKVDMDRSPFSERFLVLSKDPALAKEIVNDSIQSILLEHSEKPFYNPIGITIGPGGAVVLTGPTVERERLRDLVELGRRIESAMNPR